MFREESLRFGKMSLWCRVRERGTNATVFLRTPPFLVMNAAYYNNLREDPASPSLAQKNSRFTETFEVLLSDYRLAPYGAVARYFAELELVDACCSDQKITRLADAGFTLPWKSVAWDPSSRKMTIGDDARSWTKISMGILQSSRVTLTDLGRRIMVMAKISEEGSPSMHRCWAQCGLRLPEALHALRDPLGRGSLLLTDLGTLGSLDWEQEWKDELARIACEQRPVAMMEELFHLGLTKARALELAVEMASPEATYIMV